MSIDPEGMRGSSRNFREVSPRCRSVRPLAHRGDVSHGEEEETKKKNAVIEKNTYGKMHGDLAYERIDICLLDP